MAKNRHKDATTKRLAAPSNGHAQSSLENAGERTRQGHGKTTSALQQENTNLKLLLTFVLGVLCTLLIMNAGDLISTSISNYAERGSVSDVSNDFKPGISAKSIEEKKHSDLHPNSRHDTQTNPVLENVVSSHGVGKPEELPMTQLPDVLKDNNNKPNREEVFLTNDDGKDNTDRRKLEPETDRTKRSDQSENKSNDLQHNKQETFKEKDPNLRNIKFDEPGKTPEYSERKLDNKRPKTSKNAENKKASQNKPKTKGVNSEHQKENKETKLPPEIENFEPTYQKTISPKKIFADGRRLPPVELLPQKPNNSSVRVFLYDDFLSEAECDGLMKAHDSHVADRSKADPYLCFSDITTLRKHLKAVHKSKLRITPNDFMPGTTCLNQTFSSQMKTWMKDNWSYSTAFYSGESRFSKIFEYRVKEATALNPENGGKFQITSYPLGIGYKTHTDCILDSGDTRDRVATILVYLQTVEEGGETTFPDLGIWVKPRKGRALVWNNMNEEGKCEPLSRHKAAKVEKGHKYILQRWYYYKSFYSLGKRPPEPQIPARPEGQARVSCDEYDHGSCRWYDEWNYDHLLDYRAQKSILI